jgi:hypothetical protein
MPTSAAETPSGYRLRVVLPGVSPLIWRRRLVPGDASVADGPAVVQIVFGWDGAHLHRFVIYGVGPEQRRRRRRRRAGRQWSRRAPSTPGGAVGDAGGARGAGAGGHRQNGQLPANQPGVPPPAAQGRGVGAAPPPDFLAAHRGGGGVLGAGYRLGRCRGVRTPAGCGRPGVAHAAQLRRRQPAVVAARQAAA